MTVPSRLVSAVLLAMLVVGCGADDREMRPPSESQTTTTTEAAPAVAAGSPSDGMTTDTQLVLQLSSTAFAPDAVIPDQHTCRGRDVSPPLEWANLPAGASELAVAMVDLDAEGYVHWLVTGIPPTTGGLPEGELPQGAVPGPNSTGGTGWTGPCPPSGTHRYEFRLLALSGPPDISSAPDARAAVGQLAQSPVLAIATLTGTVTAAAD